MIKRFVGSIVAVVTPMYENGEVDEISLRKLLEWHIAQGTNGVVINGSTGEGIALSYSEQQRQIEIAVEVIAGRIPVIANTGTSSTSSTIAATQAAIAAGVDGCLIVTPYYNRPTQEGLYQHFKAIALACAIPILLYNVPKRTASDLLPETVARLSEIQNIVGIKEATGELARVAVLRALCKQDFVLLSGDDSTALEFMRLGGDGSISVAANVAPKMVAEVIAKAKLEVATIAQELDAKLQPLYQALGLESNPIPVKWALARMGMVRHGIRLPLMPLDVKYHATMEQALRSIGVT